MTVTFFSFWKRQRVVLVLQQHHGARRELALQFQAFGTAEGRSTLVSST